MPITLDQLNAASPTDAAARLDGLYAHSPWIVEQTVAAAHAADAGSAPFRSVAHFKHALAATVSATSAEAQLALIRAPPAPRHP